MSFPKRWLILAHSFNADGRAASQTITDKLPALMEAGIELTVISAATGTRDTRFRHIQKMPWGPSGWRFDFRHIMQRRFGRGLFYRISTLIVSIALLPLIVIERVLFGLSNQAAWVLPAALSGLRLARRGEIDLVYSTGGAASAHHAAAIIKAHSQIPWIAEIHDPMVVRENAADDGRSPRGDRNGRYLQRLEARICREADLVWWFTGAALAYAKERTPALGDKGLVLLPGAKQPPVTGEHHYGETLDICHFGAISDSRSLEPVVRALHDLASRRPEIVGQLRIHSYGSALDHAAEVALQETGRSEMVIAHDRLPRLDATRVMHEADVLLMLHGDYEWCSEYIPSKIYEYIWAGRPILAVTNRNEFLDNLLHERNTYVSHTLDTASIATALSQIWDDWNSHQLREPKGDPVTIESAVETILSRVSAIT